jgi:hypothetical protein
MLKKIDRRVCTIYEMSLHKVESAGVRKLLMLILLSLFDGESVGVKGLKSDELFPIFVGD